MKTLQIEDLEAALRFFFRNNIGGIGSTNSYTVGLIKEAKASLYLHDPDIGHLERKNYEHSERVSRSKKKAAQ